MKHIHDDLRMTKKSLNALQVAREIKSKLAKGEKINVKEIQVSKGYSLHSAHANKAIRTKTFQRAMSSTIQQLDLAISKAMTSILNKDHDLEKYRDLVEGVDKLTKNSRLLQDKSTVNVANNVIVYGSDDFLALQVSTE